MDKFDQDARAEFANGNLTAANNRSPSLWDQITEKGKSILDATGHVISDVLEGRAIVATENQANSELRDIRRFQAQLAADNLANGWVDDGLVMRRIGPVATALGPEQMMPGRENSFEQVQARSLNEGLQMAAADALMAPVLAKIGQGLSSFLSEEVKLNYGLSQEIRASLNADLPMPTSMSGLSPQTTGANAVAAEVGELADLSLSKRHLLGSLSIPKATGNSLFLGSREAAMTDLAEIQSGAAIRTGELFETSSSRVWGTHNSSVHPVSGPDVVNVSSQEYNILVQAQKQGAEKALITLDKMAQKNLFTPEQVTRTQNIINLTRSKKGG